MSRFIIREAGSDGDDHEDEDESRESKEELEYENIFANSDAEEDERSSCRKVTPSRTRASSQSSIDSNENAQIETNFTSPTPSAPPTPTAKASPREKRKPSGPHQDSRANHKKYPDVTKILYQRVPQILMAGELIYDFYSINFDYRKTKLVNLTQLWKNYPVILERVVQHLKVDKDVLCFFVKLETNEGKKDKKQKATVQAAGPEAPTIPPVYQTRVVDGKTVAEAIPIRKKKRRKPSLAEEVQGHMNNGEAIGGVAEEDEDADEPEEDPYEEPADAPEPMEATPTPASTSAPATTDIANTMRGRWHMHLIVYRPRVSVPPYNPENFRKLLSIWFGASRVDAHIVSSIDHLTAKQTKEMQDKMSGGLSYTLKGVPCALTTFWWQKINGKTHDLAYWTRWKSDPDGSNKRLESEFAPHPLPTFYRGALWNTPRHQHACHEFEQLIAQLHSLRRPTVKDGDFSPSAAEGAGAANARSLAQVSEHFSPLPVPATTGKWAKVRADKQALMTLLERYGFVYGVENSCLYRRRVGSEYTVENFGALSEWTILVDKFASLFTAEEWVTFEDIVTRYEWAKMANWFPLMRELKRYRRYAAWDFVELADHSILCLSTGALYVTLAERRLWLTEQQEESTTERPRSGGFACHFDPVVTSQSIKELPLNWLKLLKDMPKPSSKTYNSASTGEYYSFKWERLLIHLANLSCYRYTKQPVPFLWGDPDCGKSTLLSPWTRLYRGHSNVDNYSAIAEISRSESAPLSQLVLGEPRLLLCLEYSSTRLKDDEEKDLLEGGTIAARMLLKNPVIRPNRCGMFFASQAEPDPEKKLSHASREALVSARYELFRATHKLIPDNAKRLAIEAEYLNVHYYLGRLRNEPELRRTQFGSEDPIYPLPPRPPASPAPPISKPAAKQTSRGSSLLLPPDNPINPLL